MQIIFITISITLIVFLTIFLCRLNTTNSTVTYETGLNSLLAVVDSYQVSSHISLD